MRGRTRLKATDRKAQIMHSAMKVFAQKGFEGATTREIAEAAGVSEALLYRHFRTKEAMYKELVAALGQGSGHLLEALTAHEPGAAGYVRTFYFLARVILVGRPDGAQDRSIDRMIGYSLLEDGAFVRSFFERLFYQLLPYLTACLEVAGREGDLAHLDVPGEDASVMFHHLIGAFALFLMPSEPVLHQTDRGVILGQVMTYGLRGAGFTAEAVARELDFVSLEQQFGLLFTHGETYDNH